MGELDLNTKNQIQLFSTYSDYMQPSQMQECMNTTLKISNNKHYNSQGSFLQMVDVCLKSVDISKNDLFKNG